MLYNNRRGARLAVPGSSMRLLTPLKPRITNHGPTNFDNDIHCDMPRHVAEQDARPSSRNREICFSVLCKRLEGFEAEPTCLILSGTTTRIDSQLTDVKRAIVDQEMAGFGFKSWYSNLQYRN